MITLINGFPQGPNGLIVPNGSISLQLNVDATIIAAPGGFVAAAIPATFQFDANGQLIQPALLYSNEELNPQLSSTLLGTYYLVIFYDQNGARINVSPMWWQFPEAAGATVDISQMIPISTVGGNVIFYPTAFLAGVTSVSITGDGVLFSSTPSAPVTSIGTLTPTLLSQHPHFFLSGPGSGSSDATPTFRAIVAADLSGLLGTSAYVYTGVLSGIPATATVGQLAFITNATPGQNVYVATATNTWTQSSSPAGGANTDVQFNDSGVLGGNAGFTYDKTAQAVVIGQSLYIPGTGITGYANVLNVLAPVNSSQTPILFGNFYDNHSFFDGVQIISYYQGNLTNAGAKHFTQSIRTGSVATGGTYGEVGALTIEVDANSSAGGTITNLYGIKVGINSGTGTAQTNYTVIEASMLGTQDATTGYGVRIPTYAGGFATNLWGFYVDNAPNYFGGNTRLTGYANSIVTKTATYQTTPTDHTILVNSAGAVTITLRTSQPGGGAFGDAYPHVLPVGQIWYVKNINTGLVTVVGQTGTIDGAANYLLSTQYQVVGFQWDGTNFQTISDSFSLVNSIPSTSILNQNGLPLTIAGSYWDGFASQPSTFTITRIVAAGTNPGMTTYFTNAGYSGGGAFSFNGVVNATGFTSAAGYFASTDVTIQETSPATNILNQNSGNLYIIGQYWNGAATALDTWSIHDVLGAGTNPTSTLTFAHTGTPGAISVDIAAPLTANTLTITAAAVAAPSTDIQLGNAVATLTGSAGSGVTTNSTASPGPASTTAVAGYLEWYIGTQAIWIPYFI